MIHDFSVTGATSNPTIFAKAITGGRHVHKMLTFASGDHARVPLVGRAILVGRVLLLALIVALALAGVSSAQAQADRAVGHVAASDNGCPDTTPTYDSPCGPLFTTPQWSDPGWTAPPQYETIQLAKLTGTGEDLIGRDTTGLWVERFDPAKGQWELVGNADGGLALSLPNKDGWNQPSQYRTIQIADLNGDGKSLLLARAADGLHVYKWDSATDTFIDISKPPRLFSNAEGGSDPSAYETIQTADLFGNGHAEVLGRTPKGILYARWDGQTGQFVDVKQTDIASNANGGEYAWVYPTIQTGDVTGDGKANLIMMGPLGGLRWYAMRSDGLFDERPVLGPIDIASGFSKPNQYETIQTARIRDSKSVVVLARFANGLRSYRFSNGTWHEVGTLGDLSNGSGFEKPSQYQTIRSGDLTGGGSVDVVARTAAGITAWQLSIPAQKWTKLSTGPTLTGPLWEDPSHYATIRLGDITGSGRSALVVRGVYGVRTFAWENGAFRRPRAYGDFPAFTGNEAAAYAEVAKLLLGHAGDFRKETYASPQETITEATLNSYERRLAERCTPVFALVVLGAPPRYKDCRPPPGSNVEATAWTAVSNQIIAELWAASGVVAHFTALDTIETKLFLDQQGSFPALDAELALRPNPPDKSATYLKLVKSGLEILGDYLQLIPVFGEFPRVIRAIALTAHSLGAVGEGLGLSSAPSPAQSYAKITADIAKLQQRERDITQAQRRYVLADYGLLSVIGSEVKGRLWTLDETAALSAGRQSFAAWATQLYLPFYWNRYRVTRCIKKTFFRKVFDCKVPNGPYVMVTHRDGEGFTDFNAVLGNQTRCYALFNGRKCDFYSPEGPLFSRIVSGISSQCRYDPTPGSTNAWRYGCSLGYPASDLIDGKAGWNLALFDCNAYLPGDCTRVATTRGRHRLQRDPAKSEPRG